MAGGLGRVFFLAISVFIPEPMLCCKLSFLTGTHLNKMLLCSAHQKQPTCDASPVQQCCCTLVLCGACPVKYHSCSGPFHLAHQGSKLHLSDAIAGCEPGPQLHLVFHSSQLSTWIKVTKLDRSQLDVSNINNNIINNNNAFQIMMS